MNSSSIRSKSLNRLFDNYDGRTYLFVYGPRQANLVLIAYASSEGSGEPAHPRSLARTFAARSYKQWIKRNLQTESQIPGPSEWLGMRSWNLSWRNARRHKFAWRGSYIHPKCNSLFMTPKLKLFIKKKKKTEHLPSFNCFQVCEANRKIHACAWKVSHSIFWSTCKGPAISLQSKYDLTFYLWLLSYLCWVLAETDH